MLLLIYNACNIACALNILISVSHPEILKLKCENACEEFGCSNCVRKFAEVPMLFSSYSLDVSLNIYLKHAFL